MVGFGGQWGYYTDNETAPVNISTPTIRIPLVLCGLRYYDPNTGRFLTRDPVGYAGGINLYTFCGNNPINYADPSGLKYDKRFWYSLAGGAIAGVLTAGNPVAIAAGAGLGSAIGSRADGNTIKQSLFNGVTDGVLTYVSGRAIGAVGSRVSRFVASKLSSAAAAQAAPAVAQVVANRAAGLSFQRLALGALGLAENHVGIPSTTFAGAAYTTIPDALEHGAITEIKDSLKLSLTKQIQAQINAARASGATYN